MTILEARDRIGGRVWSYDLGETTVDLGGSWIHGPEENPLMPLVAEAGISYHNDGDFGDAAGIWIAGKGWATDAVGMLSSLWHFDHAAVADALGGDGPYPDGVNWYIQDRGYTVESARYFDFIINWLEGNLIQAGQPEDISLAGTAAYVEYEGGNLALAGGYGSVVHYLAEGADIKLGEKVLAIEHGGRQAVVSTTETTYRADRVAVTVPLGVLKKGDIVFDPPLPASRQAALDRMQMGTLEKVVATFNEVFWPADSRMYYLSDDHRFPAWFDISHHTGRPTLVCFYNPVSTPEIAALAAAERVGPALEVLAEMMGGSVPVPVTTVATDWRNDPLARGSYSFAAVGSGPDDMLLCGQPVSDLLYFAGEHTVPENFGTVHGAYVSGRRAARAIGTGFFTPMEQSGITGAAVNLEKGG